MSDTEEAADVGGDVDGGDAGSAGAGGVDGDAEHLHEIEGVDGGDDDGGALDDSRGGGGFGAGDDEMLGASPALDRGVSPGAFSGGGGSPAGGVEGRVSAYEAVKDAVLAAVNAARAGAGSGLPPLAPHPTASAVADDHAREMAESGYTSPYGLDGRKPYARAFFGGVSGHVYELVAGFDAPRRGDIAGRDESVRDTVLELLRANGDGWRREFLSGRHTHLGVGVGTSRTAVRLSLLFVDAAAAVELPAPAPGAPDYLLSSEESFLIVRTAAAAEGVLAALVYYEPEPAPLAPGAADARRGYDDYTDEKVAVVWPWDMERQPDGALKVPVYLASLRPGHYYVQVCVRAFIFGCVYVCVSL